MNPKEKSTVGIITVNNDTFTNPTLYALIQYLSESGHHIVLFNKKNQGLKPSTLDNITYLDAPQGIRTPKKPLNFLKYVATYQKIASTIKKAGIVNLVAVDPNGLILAGRLKRLQKNIHIHYFSFELFFTNEIGNNAAYKAIKKLEIKYSQQVTSIVIQDEVRKQLLIKENKINPNFKNWHLIPVSPAMARQQPQKKHNRVSFGLKDSDTFYVYSGSIASWSGIEELIRSIKKGLPPDTYILIHNKAPFNQNDPLHQQLFELRETCPNLILHGAVFDEYEDYLDFLTIFNYGIIIYKPDGGIFTGQNIKDIGLSSGKLACYMAVGLPCLLYQCTTYVNLVEQYAIGAIIDEEHDLSYHFRHRALETLGKEACLKFYKEVLDPANTIPFFIEQELLKSR